MFKSTSGGAGGGGVELPNRGRCTTSGVVGKSFLDALGVNADEEALVGEFWNNPVMQTNQQVRILINQ